MANPQPEPFLKFSKELFDALLLSPMPATHKEIVLAVIRRTYGDHGRKSAPIAQSLLRRMIGRHKNGIRQSLRELIGEGVIVQVTPPSFGSSAVLRLNKDYEAWGKWSVDSHTVMEEAQDMGEVHPAVGGEVHPAVPQQDMGEVQQSVGGEVHPAVPMEDKEILEEQENNVGADPGTNPPPREPRPDDLVAFFVDHHVELGRTRPDRRRIGIAAKAIKEQRELGASIDVIRQAIRRMVAESKPPSWLGQLVSDVERDAQRNGGAYGRAAATSGRSLNGEF